MATKVLPDGYRETIEIDLINDKTHLQIIAKSSLMMLLLSLIPLIILLFIHKDALSFFAFIKITGISILIAIPCFALHELLHGILMKIYSKEKIDYGFDKTGFLYATTPNIYYPKAEFLQILLLPAILLNIILLLAAFLLPALWSLGICFVFMLHFSGCAGDLYYLKQIKGLRGDLFICDTKTGIIIYNKTE